MKTQDTLRARLGMPMPPLCLRCDAPMKIKTVTPTMFTQTVDEVVFRCSACEAEMKRLVRQSE